MITAQQARNNAIQSEQQVEKWLEKLSPQIEAVSKQGQRSAYFFYSTLEDGVDSYNHPYWVRVREALKKLGYTVSQGQVKVGGGFGDIDFDPNNPRMEPVVRISW